MKKIFLVLTALIISISAFSQTNYNGIKVYAGKKDYEENIFKRTLLVRLLSHNEQFYANEMERANKQKNETKKQEVLKGIDKEKAFIDDYNKYIKATIEKYWKLNQNIEYKTHEEIKNIPANERKNYVCLYNIYSDLAWYPTIKSIKLDRLERSYFSNIALIPDYENYFPYAYNTDRLREPDFDMMIRLMIEHINMIVKVDKKLDFFEFLELKEKENNKSIGDKTIFVCDTSVYKQKGLDEKEIAESCCGMKVKLVKENYLYDNYYNAGDSDVYMVVFYANFFIKTIISPKDMKVYGVAGPITSYRIPNYTIAAVGETTFKHACKCK